MEKAMLKKILWSVLILAIGISSFTGFFNTVFVEGTFIGHIDRSADAYLDETMKKALFTFAVVRGINAVISVVQGSDVAVSPAGVGVTIAMGEILDPLNDLMERFSWVILASTVSLGIQRLLMGVAVWLGFRILLTLAMAFLLVGLWFPRLFGGRMMAVGYKWIVLSGLVRVCIPAVAVATDHVDGLFLNPRYRQATQVLEKMGGEIEQRNTGMQDRSEDANVLERIKFLFAGVKDAVNAEETIRRVKDRVSETIAYIIDLIVVFFLQTILIPLIVLWVLVRLVNSLVGMNLVEMTRRAFGRLRGRTYST